MKILIVAATENELQPLLQEFNFHKDKNVFSGSIEKHKITVLITGIGIPHTLLKLIQYLENQQVDFVVNAGIAGAFTETFAPGEVVNVSSDCFADIGYEDGNDFIPFSRTSMVNENEFPFKNNWLINNTNYKQLDFKQVKGITVNTVNGNETSIHQMRKIYQPDVETMEGAAVAFCCLHYKVNFIQLRAISNKVEKRNKASWNIQLAIENLNKVLETYIKRM